MIPKTDLAGEVIKKALKGGAYSEKQIHQVAFHLTDWLEDLVPFVDFLENPDKYEKDAVFEIIIRFLADAPNHIKSAADIVLEPGNDKE